MQHMQRKTDLNNNSDPSLKSDLKKDSNLFRKISAYFLAYPWHLAITVGLLILAKLSNLGVPILIKQLINHLTKIANNQSQATVMMVGVPLGLIVAYVTCRFLAYLFDEICGWVFAHVTENTLQAISLDVFRHLLNLSLSFHLHKQGGRLHREIDRGSRGIRSLVSYSLYRIFPTFLEIGIVLTWLLTQYRFWYAVVVFIALALYITYTFMVTEWRGAFRKRMNELDNQVSQNTYDALLNYETIKYAGNEKLEAKRYAEQMKELSSATIQNDRSLSALDFGQQVIICISLVTILIMAAYDIQAKNITLGDFVLINALMLQLYTPLFFLGMMYREIRQALLDTTRLFELLQEPVEIKDSTKNIELNTQTPTIRFKNIHFGYDEKRQILKDIDFEVPAGTTTAIVGHSGSGKSTLTKLLFRFYEIHNKAENKTENKADNESGIYINNINIKDISQASLRKHMAVVAQDTVLFNDTLAYNIRYGKPDATEEEYVAASQAADLHAFAQHLSHGYDTMVGERGLKLSGGEKQRVAIARALLKQAPILILDEATSALDSKTEHAIQQAFHRLSLNRTTLIIAHRLSTITHAEQIIVMDKGSIIERGTHQELLDKNGTYAHMWLVQSKKHKKNTIQHIEEGLEESI
jgi:ATP-binding cassette, subfamily B, heavy metal transporter